MRLSSGLPALCSRTCFCTSIAQLTASTALANSTSAPSPMSLTIRPEWAAISGSMRSRLMAFKRARVPASSIPMRREYPTTSADRIAASLLWTRSSAIQAAPRESRDPIRLYGSLGCVSIVARITDNGMVRPCSCPVSDRSWQGAPKTRSTLCLTISTTQ